MSRPTHEATTAMKSQTQKATMAMSRPTHETATIIRFANLFDEMAYIQHQRMVDKGFWTKGEPRNFGEAIALMHSELSEALESHRHNDPPDEHCPEFTSKEVELADTVIRILDVAGGEKLRIGAAIEAKMKYNLTRPHKHGKTC